MTVQENRLRTQRTTPEDTQYSGINIIVNGGNVCLLIGDSEKKQVWKVVNSKKKKHAPMSRLKRWIQKKFTRSAKVVTKPVQESSCDTTSSSSLELQGKNQILTAKEHSLKNGVMPVTETENDSSVLADDDHFSNHSLDCISVKKKTYQPEENQRSASCLSSGNLPFLNHATSETNLKLHITHQDDLHLVKPSSSQLKIPVDESTNTHDKSVNVVSPDVVDSWFERSFSSGYPDESISSQCHESTHLLSNDSFSNRMFGRNPELENKERCQKDQCVDDNLFPSKTSEEDEESELNNLPSIDDNPFHSKTSEEDEESELKNVSSKPWTNAPFKLTRIPISKSLVADDTCISARPDSCPDSCSGMNGDVELEEYSVHVSAGKNITIDIDKCLTIAEVQKQFTHNAMTDCTITDSRPVSDIKSSDLDFIGKGKISYRLVASGKVPIAYKNERFSHSTFPSSCDIDIVAAQTKMKTRQCKKKLRKKCKKSELSCVETSSSQCHGSRLLLSNDSFFNKTCGRNPELDGKEGCQNDECFGGYSFQSKTSEADKLSEFIHSNSSSTIKAPFEIAEKTNLDRLNAYDIYACPDSCSNRDTNADQKYTTKCIKKSYECRPSKEIDCISPVFTVKRVDVRFIYPLDEDAFCQFRPDNLILRVLKVKSKYWAFVVTKPTGKTESLVPASTWNRKHRRVFYADHKYFQMNGKEQIEIQNRNVFFNMIHRIDLPRNHFFTLERSSLPLRHNEMNMRIVMSSKQTKRNVMGDCTSTDLCDIHNSNLDCLAKETLGYKLIVTEELPFEKQNERVSHSTLPSSCNVDVVAAQKKKTRKCKRKYRKKCKKTDLPCVEACSLASSSLNESFSDNNSVGYHNSNYQAHIPHRRKGSPKNTKPPCRDNSVIKQCCSSLADSGIGASLDPFSVSWCTDDVESELIACPIRKKKIGSFDSLRHVKNSYSFKKQCNKFFRNQQMKKIKSIVRELHVDHRYLQFNQFGLGSYFDRLNNGSPPSLQEQMRYEWLRLASFQNYTGAGNALNLARNGFYHRHTDGPSSTRCAYCDVIHSSWEYFDNLEASHRQMSPNCPFHEDRSDESLNVSINNDGQEVCINLESGPFQPSASVCEVSDVNGNTVKPSTNPESVIPRVDSREQPECIPRRADTVTSSSRVDQNNANSAGNTHTLSRSLTLTLAVDEVARCLGNTNVSQANTNGESVSQQPTEDPEGRERRTGERVSDLARTSSNDPVGNYASQNPAPDNRDSTPSALENVKHPDYRTMAQRVNSFQGFPDYLDQTPEQMAQAGFYFVGVADFTRCFCCGGGLRNWEAGDDPLLEHTRWFPRCKYVLRLKGERYVAAIQRRHKEHMKEQRRQQIEIANQRDANRNPPDPMTTDAASVMREMGYVDQRIRETILAVRRQIGTHMITTQQVLSWLLDQVGDSTTTTAASSVYQTGHETNSIYTGINMAREADDSNYTTAAPAGINTTVSTTALKTRESVQRSGSNNAAAASSGNGNQQTDTKSTASGADASLVSGPSSQTGTKRNGKKNKAKGNTKTGQPAGANGGPDTDATRKLLAENEKLRGMQTCKVCMERPVNTTMLPCGHLVCCDICASRLRDCPVCRKRIKGTVKTFMS